MRLWEGKSLGGKELSKDSTRLVTWYAVCIEGELRSLCWCKLYQFCQQAAITWQNILSKFFDDSSFFTLNIWSGKHWMFVQQKESTLSRILVIIHENIYYFRLANWRNTNKNWVRLVSTCSSMHNNQSQDSSKKRWIGISRQH